MTPEVVTKLEEAFLLGCTDQEACFFAGISRNTMHNYQRENPEFRDRKQVLKSNPVLMARIVIIKALENGDTATANRILDRAEGRKMEVTAERNRPIRLVIQPTIAETV